MPSLLTAIPSVLLLNAASNTSYMPITGAGSGGYSGLMNTSYGAYPECFNACADPQCASPDPPGFQGCGEYVQASIASWLLLGGRHWRVGSKVGLHTSHQGLVTPLHARQGAGCRREGREEAAVHGY